MFQYEEYAVSGEASFFIKKLWTLNNAANPNPVEQKSILPNGCFTIAIIKAGTVRVRLGGQAMSLTQGVYYCGQMTKRIEVDIRAGAKATMIQIFPWTPVHFPVLPDLSPFTDSIVPVQQVASALPLHWESLLSLPSESQIGRYVTAYVGRLIHQTSASWLITRACRMLLEGKGDVSVEKLSTELHCSRRHLQKLFKRWVGISPKAFALILKVRESVDALAYPNPLPDPTLTNLALANRFYDQAHFNNTFRSIVETTPKQFKAENYFLALKK